MGARVEIAIDPAEFFWGTSFVTQIGSETYRIVVNTEIIVHELAFCSDQISYLIADPLTSPNLKKLAEDFVVNAYEYLIMHPEGPPLDSIIRGRIKHEYHHLEQFLSVFINRDGSRTNIDELIKIEQAYIKGDRAGRVKKKILDDLDSSIVKLKAASELEAIIAELEMDSLFPGEVNRGQLIWRISTVLGHISNKSAMLNRSHAHHRAILILLSGDMNLLLVNHDDFLNYDNLLNKCLTSLEQSITNPQDFYGCLRKNFANKVRPALSSAFQEYMHAHRAYLQEAISKGVIPKYS